MTTNDHQSRSAGQTHHRLVLAAGAAEFRSWLCVAPLARSLISRGRERRALRAELRRLETDPEYAADWRIELAEGWRRNEFDRALLRVLDARSDGGDPG
ncbi:hypothetical protein [Streptomyces sp. NPDC020141]|uniref:hypothetical protein n=1 Tax=Streptomyces sp. NPDC020141 TaxID=3365065 RepID=UPI0037909270